MQLVLIKLRRGAAFEIGNVRTFFSNDQRSLKLSRLGVVDAEVSRQLHRTANAFRNETKTAVRKDRAIQCREKIVVRRHNRAEIFLNQLRIFFDRFCERTEDHAVLLEFLFVSCGNRNRIETPHRPQRPASCFCSVSGMPSFSKVRNSSGSTSSRLAFVAFCLGAL